MIGKEDNTHGMMTLLEDEEGMLSGQLGRGFLYRQGMGEHVCTMTASWN